jgi:putative ABC transport system permease protein
MQWSNELTSALRSLFRRRQEEQQLHEELQFHLERLIEHNLAAGMPPEEARYAALRLFGGVQQAKEECRDMGRVNFIEHLIQDLRYGMRQIRRTPGFAAVAVVTLALGIGANTAIFSFVNGVLLQPLPYKEASRLVFVAGTNEKQGVKVDVTSYPDFADWRAQNRVFSGLAAYRAQYYDLSGRGVPERTRGVRITEDLLELLEESPELGRSFAPEEYQPGSDHVVLLSDGLSRRLFAGDPQIVGRALRLNDDVYTVIGIMPSSFQFPPTENADLYAPLTPDANRHHGWLFSVGRLKPGVSLQQAQAEMDTIARRLEQQYPGSNKGVGVNVLSLQESVVVDLRPALLVFSCAVGLVLLIACGNVANLMLSRSTARERELAVRAALGAARGRLMQQVLTENVLLGLRGGTLGLALAVWGVRALVAMLKFRVPPSQLESIHIDGWVLSFTFLVSMLTGITFGLAPALVASRLELNESLKEGPRGVAGTVRSGRLRGVLVVSEVALSVVLLVGAGLMIKSFVLLTNVDTGIEARNVLAMDFSLQESKYGKPHVRADFLQQVAERVRMLPGVQSASWVTDLPMSDYTDGLSFSIVGQPDAPGTHRSASFNVVGPGYFKTLRIPLIRGRDFTDHDTDTAPGVVLINQAVVRRFWPEEDPLGKQITMDGKRFFSIIGVVGNIRQQGPASQTSPEVYLSYLQDPVDWPYRTLVVRSGGDPLKLVGLVQQAVWSVNKDQPISHTRTMEQVRAGSVAQPRVFAVVLGVFAALALVLASVGIYGVVSYSVAQRSHEVGVRKALGAENTDVLRLVLGEGMVHVAVGLGIGLAGALALTRLLSGFLYGVRPTDLITYGAVALVLTGAALLACYLPARRAMKVEPMVALRYE